MNGRLPMFHRWWSEFHPNQGGWLRKLFRAAARPNSEPTLPLGTLNLNTAPTWLPIANVVVERRFGPGGNELRTGTKLLAPGGKVYVFGEHRSSCGEVVVVVGRHRRSKRYITCHVRTRHLENWRVERVHSPYVLRQVHAWGWFAEPSRADTETERARAESIARKFHARGPGSTLAKQHPNPA